MFCHKCGREASEANAFCTACGTALAQDENPKPEDYPACPSSSKTTPAVVPEALDSPGAAPRQDRASSKNRALIVGAALLALIAVGSIVWALTARPAAEAPIATTESEPTEAPESALVPDLVALVGESTFTADDAINQEDESPRRYGAGDLAEGYREAAEAAGFTVELVSWDEYEEELGGGRAGWPCGQDPAPGELAPLGSAIRLIIVDDPEYPSTTGSARTELYEPQEGGPEREAILYACEEYLVPADRLVFDKVQIKGNKAFASLSPAAGGDSVDVYLFGTEGVWQVTYAVYSDGGVTDGLGVYMGQFEEQCLPTGTYSEMQNWISAPGENTGGSVTTSGNPLMIRSAGIGQIVPGAEFVLEDAEMERLHVPSASVQDQYALGYCEFDLPDGTHIGVSADQHVSISAGGASLTTDLRVRVVVVNPSSYQTDVRVEILGAM